MSQPPGAARNLQDVKPYGRICVVGGGAWGTALAAVGVRAGRNVSQWSRDAATATEIALNQVNSRYLPDIDLPPGIEATPDLESAIAGAEAILIITPSTSIREVTHAVAAHSAADVPIFAGAKGIEAESGLLMTGIMAEEAPGRVLGAISGPTFAVETAQDLPTAVTVACSTRGMAASRMAATLTTYSFRPYVSDDLVGVEIGGAVKNVIAIACGMVKGAGLGENLRAALITRGLSEIKELAVLLGGSRETVTGLSGMGDLMLTCSSEKSRNFSYGLQRGAGVAEGDVFEGRPVVVEGRDNAMTVTDLARARGLHMPICEMVRAIVAEGAPIGDAFATYWSAPIEAEPRALDVAIAHPAQDAARDYFGDTNR
ncbi:NAD(P)H-dependent glycerol-3-phosphate dehydrogenase [Roseobacter sp. HKCCA0434]|uniref:NAD(P)H-dependent glycerol-3-phosphate dehydrogenase n=1 Tax=Roseobacter sp. HKCCA0434 TaxID=3079297 RepID=UPI002905A6BC|nr:NAD(P)H-dependent glycerol-3-phosphate dehydrogenase [Roseobacter sp. HKCCA0434]